MIRTQIQLTEKQVRGLKRRARKDGVSMAEVIRRAVDVAIDSESPNRADLVRKALALSGKFHSGLKDLSENHDKYLEETFRS